VPVWAHTSYQLARVIGDRTAKLSLLRDAAGVFDTEDTIDYAIATYKRILQADPGAPELTRLLELLRERAGIPQLVALLSDRLAWLEAEAEAGADGVEKQMVPLLLERATVLHSLGDHAAAMADLDALLDRSASNVEALRFRADLAMNAGDVESAVALWK